MTFMIPTKSIRGNHFQVFKEIITGEVIGFGYSILNGEIKDTNFKIRCAGGKEALGECFEFHGDLDADLLEREFPELFL